jgi:glycosyltransferase involved in cell wall biosynthesis
LRVLYINNSGFFGGAQKSLLELLKISGKSISKFIITSDGIFSSILRKNNIKNIVSAIGISCFDNTQYSYYRGFRWFILLREIFYLPFTFTALLKAKKKWKKFSIIHINGISLIPSIYISKKLFKCPVIVHVRDVQRPWTDLRGKFLLYFYKKNVEKFIAIDSTVKKSMHPLLPVKVIHNGIFIKSKKVYRKKLIHNKIFNVGMVGSLLKSKGCLDFLEAAKICLEKNVNINFIFFGSSIRKKNIILDYFLSMFKIYENIEYELKLKINEYGIQNNVKFIPFTDNLNNIYSNLDLLCFPSHLNAPGRPIFEAASYGVPSIVSIKKSTTDTIINNKTGKIIEKFNFQQLAREILDYYYDRKKLYLHGNNAKILANRNNNIKKNYKQIVSLYKSIILN